MRAGRVGGISLLVVGMMAQGFPALAQQGGTTPAPAGSGSEAPPASGEPAPAGSAGAAPPPAAPSQQSPPDLVELKDGGMYRGTISELVPDDHVVIVTVTGASKTFDMKDVKYAGPASQAPGAAAPAAPSKPQGEEKHEKKEERTKPIITVHADEARLLIKGDKSGLTLYRKSATAVAVGAGGGVAASGYDVICTAPCDASLPAGTETLAVSNGKGSPVEAEPVHLPAGESRLTAHYESKKGMRVGGWVVFGVSDAVGIGLLMAGLLKTKQSCSDYGGCVDEPTTDGGLVAAGIVVFALGLSVSLPMVLQRDKVSIKLTSIDAARLRHPSWSNPALDRASSHPAEAPGLGLTARF